MSEGYGKPAIVPLRFDFENSRLTDAQAYLTLSRKDVLGIVQSAFDELGPQDTRLTEVKRDVLEHVSEGKLGLALRAAIVGAGKAGCS